MKNLLSLVCASVALYGANAEFYPLKCGSSTSDVSKCYFQGDYCNFFEDFDGPLSAVNFHNYNGDPNTADFVVESGTPNIKDGILHMPLIKGSGRQSFATIMSSTRFLNYGSFEARMAVVGQSSVISTFISMSNVEDEIDFEFVPNKPEAHNEVQTNWFYRGEKVFGVNFWAGQTPSNTFDNFHTYKVDISPQSISWSINGKVVRTVEKSKMSNPNKFPGDTPPRIQFGVWQALDNNWAGPDNIDWSKNMNVRIDWISIKAAECRNQPTPSKSFSITHPKNTTLTKDDKGNGNNGNLKITDDTSNSGSTKDDTTNTGSKSNNAIGSGDGNSFSGGKDSTAKSDAASVTASMLTLVSGFLTLFF